MKKEKQIILITGASSGLGRETAIKLAMEGHQVFAGIRKKIDKIELENLSENIKGVYIDITNPSSIDKAFWFIIKNTKKLDVLINNAGIAVAGPIECIDVRKVKEQFDVNTFGALAVAQKFLPLLHNGRIINISSMAASGIFPFLSPYCASKRAMDILFNSFALENKDNIKVVSIKPASIKTPIWNKSVESSKKYFENVNENVKEKYLKEFLFMEKRAFENNEKAIDSAEAVEKIIKIVCKKNPKPVYNIGVQSVFTELISRLLPVCLTNKIIKLRLKRI
ncbi:MAG: SDR family oxidoreductase [Candidatus Gastranaerophilales bacterium]|nr:SDR family oxidoreductase [Candidatus Gastranaerophilales bacterium]